MLAYVRLRSIESSCEIIALRQRSVCGDVIHSSRLSGSAGGGKVGVIIAGYDYLRRVRRIDFW